MIDYIYRFKIFVRQQTNAKHFLRLADRWPIVLIVYFGWNEERMEETAAHLGCYTIYTETVKTIIITAR
jgi:hypothetical protein